MSVSMTRAMTMTEAMTVAAVTTGMDLTHSPSRQLRAPSLPSLPSRERAPRPGPGGLGSCFSGLEGGGVPRRPPGPHGEWDAGAGEDVERDHWRAVLLLGMGRIVVQESRAERLARLEEDDGEAARCGLEYLPYRIA